MQRHVDLLLKRYFTLLESGRLGDDGTKAKSPHLAGYAPFVLGDTSLTVIKGLVQSGSCDGITLDHTNLQNARILFA